MQVTPGMTTEGGGDLTALANFLDVDGDGLKITELGGLVRITANSTSYPCTSLDFDPDDIDGIIEKLREKQAEARGITL
jgi:hypothetical protein